MFKLVNEWKYENNMIGEYCINAHLQTYTLFIICVYYSNFKATDIFRDANTHARVGRTNSLCICVTRIYFTRASVWREQSWTRSHFRSISKVTQTWVIHVTCALVHFGCRARRGRNSCSRRSIFRVSIRDSRGGGWWIDLRSVVAREEPT